MTKYGVFITTSSDTTKGWITPNSEQNLSPKCEPRQRITIYLAKHKRVAGENTESIECKHFLEYVDPDKPRHARRCIADQNQARKPSRGFAKYINRTVNQERPD
jgi:hypothetical protein